MPKALSSHALRALSASPAAQLGAFIAAAFALAALGAPGLAAIGQHAALADSPNPYFIPGRALALNVFLPAAGVAMGVSLLGPGLLLAYALGRGREEFGVFVLKGFALSFPMLGAAPLLAAAAGAAPLTGAAAFAVLAAMILAAFAAARTAESAALRAHAERRTIFTDRAPDIALCLLAPFLTIALMSAKFYWEDLNPDGAHLFKTARMSVLTGGIFWPAGTPELLANTPTPNNVLQFIPAAWMMRLAGETELALRLVLPLGLGAMAAGLCAAIRHERTLERPWAVVAGLGAGLCFFAFILAFNTSYYPYFADIAIPAAREPLLIAAFLGFALSSLAERRASTLGFALLTYAGGPNGLVMMGFWTAAMTLAAWRPWRLRRAAFALGAALFAALAAAAAEAILTRLDLAAIGNEFGLRHLVDRIRFVSLDSWPRLQYWLLGCGVLPGLALAAWSRQDVVARAFTLTTLLYFAFFYVQAYRILPHHFAPAMALPLVVLWRLRPSATGSRPFAAPAALAASLALAAAGAWPSTTRPHTHGREFAARIAIEASASLDIDAAVMSHALFDKAFPRANTESGWRERYYGASLGWYVYAARGADLDPSSDYRLRRPGSSPRPDEIVLARCAGWTLSARNAAVYARDSAVAGAKSSISSVFYVPREEIFSRGAASGSRRVVDLAAPAASLLAQSRRAAAPSLQAAPSVCG